MPFVTIRRPDEARVFREMEPALEWIGEEL